MKGVDLSNYALEDLLAFDDIFLDYFNTYLKNQAFPQLVQYNRYLGLFEELEPTSQSIVQTDRLPKHVTIGSGGAHSNKLSSNFSANNNNKGLTFNLNETEQNKVFDWVRHERLPLFFRTDFFRDFKLCKLLTRSLDDERSDSATSSQLIGGYSRQSPPVSMTLSTEDPEGRTTAGPAILYASASHNPANEDLSQYSGTKQTNNYTGDNEHDFDTSNRFDLSNIDLPYLEKFNKVLFQRPGSRALSVPSYFPFASINHYTSSNLFNKSSEGRNSNVKKRTATSKSYKSSSKSNTAASLSLRRQENFEDLSKLNDVIMANTNTNDYDASTTTNRKSSKKSQSSDKKTIGFNLKENYNQTKENNNNNPDTNKEYFNELNSSFENDNENDEDQYDEDDDEEDYETGDKMQLKIDDNLSFIGDEDDATETYVDYTEKIHASINQYKLKFLGSVLGMQEFKEFLRNTVGYRLIRFWLDCEFYRDSMQDYDQIENMATRNRLFRDINEKYVFSFAKKVHEKISENYINNQCLNHNLFDRIQYDILRRLRSYWVPRFILNKLKVKGKDYGSFPLPPLTPDYSRQSTYMSAPPSSKFVEKFQKEIRLGSAGQDQKATLYSKVKKALFADKDAGGPFLRFISANNPENLPLILFWYDVCDFNEADSVGFDKNSRLQHAWAIYNSYLSSTARFNIGLPHDVSEEARKSLQYQSNSPTSVVNDIDINIFQPVMEQIVPYLEEAWIKFVKDDVTKYTKARLSALNLKRDDDDEHDDESEGGSLFDTMPEPDMLIENDTVFVTRSWIPDFLANQTRNQVETIQKKVTLSEKEKAERLQQRKQMEMERKKALKAALKRAKLKKLNNIDEERQDESPIRRKIIKSVDTAERLEREKEKEREEEERRRKKEQNRKGTFLTDKAALFDKMLANKSMMQIFRKFFVDNGQRDLLNLFNAYLEAKQILDTNDQTKRATSATNFQKTYLDPNSKKTLLPLKETLGQQLQADYVLDPRLSRPHTPFLQAFVKDYRSFFENQFQRFSEIQASEHNMPHPEDFASLNQTELLTLLGDSYNPKDFDFEEEKGEGKLLPSREDRTEFLHILYDWSIGKNSEKFTGFFAHCSEHGRKDGLPFLYNDLLFCVDSIRLKEINGEEILKQKAVIVTECYLDSSIEPHTQIDVNHETQQKLLKSAGRIAQGNQTSADITVFDEARSVLFKELLPYWAGFKLFLKQSSATPITKQEKMLRERLNEFLNTKTPSPNFKLPRLSPRPVSVSPSVSKALQVQSQQNAQKHQETLNIMFSLSTGIRFKDERNNVNTAGSKDNMPNGGGLLNDRRNSHAISQSHR